MAGWQFRVASNAAASSWTDHTGDIERTTARFTGQAFDGQIGQGGVDLDDPSGNLVIPGYRVWQLIKDGLHLERGRIGIRDYERGVNRIGDSHERDITLIDCNADLSRIGVHGWSRPEETDRARVLALVAAFLNGSPRASTVIGTAGVRNANTRTMPAKRYDNANPHEVLQDCADTAAKIFFVTVADDGTMDLFYDISTYTGYAAGISITDDDPDLVTEFPPINPTRSVDPEELFSRVRVTYGNGSSSVTAVNSGVETAHDYLETIYHDDNATTSTAQHRANTFLDIKDQEEITRRCAVAVPEANLADIRRGMTISYRAAATNDLTPVTRRIAQLTWQPPIADGQDWLAILELDLPLKIGQRYTKTKPPSDLIKEIDQAQYPYCVMTYQRETFSRFELSDLGDSEFVGGPAWSTSGLGAVSSVNGFEGILAATDPGGADARAAVALAFTAGDIELLVQWTIEDTSGDSLSKGALGLWDSTDRVASIDIDAGVGGTTCVFKLYLTGGVLDAQVSVFDATIAIGDTFWVRMLIDGAVLKAAVSKNSPPDGGTWDGTDTAAGTPDVPNILDIGVLDEDTLRVDTIAVLQGLPVSCLVIGWSDTPVPGQEIDEDLGLGDGTTTTFTLDYDAAPGSIEVEVDGIDQTPSIIFHDGDTFHLDFAPESDERVRVSYKKAA